MLTQLLKRFTNDYTEVPLFYVTREEGSFQTKLHPSFHKDELIAKQLQDIIEHVESLSIEIQENQALFYVTFNLQKYKENGEKGSCDLKLHPACKGDEFTIHRLNELVDHVRSHYDMESLSK